MVDNTKFLADNVVLNDINGVNLVATRGAGDDVLVSYVGFENSVKNVMRPIFKAFIGDFYVNKAEKYKNSDINDGVFLYLLLGKEPRVLLKADFPDLAAFYGFSTESFNTPTIFDFPRYMDRGGSFSFAEKFEGKVKEHSLRIDNAGVLTTSTNGKHKHPMTFTDISGESRTTAYINDSLQDPALGGNGGVNTGEAGDHSHTMPAHGHSGKGGDAGAVENTPNHQYEQLYVRAKLLF